MARFWLLLAAIGGLLSGCERVAERKPWTDLVEMDMLIASIWPHFETETLYPIDIEFQRVRKMPDGRVCGEVNLKGDPGQRLGFTVFLDPMTEGSKPIIIRPGRELPTDYKDVVATCMSAEQRDDFEKEMTAAARQTKRDIDQAYRESREALRREQQGMLGSTSSPYYSTPRSQSGLWGTRPQQRPTPSWQRPDAAAIRERALSSINGR